MTAQRTKKNIRFIQGRVVSDKMDKTRVIIVETIKMHPVFKKAVKRSRHFKIHDERNECKVGDLVSAMETRRLSKEKRHRLVKILERAT